MQIKDLFNSHMRNHNLVFTDFTICFSDEDAAEFRTFIISVLYCAAYSTQSPEDLTSDSFLSDVDAMLVPEWYRGPLALFNPLEENQNLEVWVTPKGKEPVIADDELIATPGLNTYTIDIREIKQRGIDNRVLQESDIPVSIRIVAGHRCLSLYIKNETPSAAVTCRNSFNIPQTVYFFGSWKRKNATEAKIAMVDGKLTSYDLVADREIEILSHPMEPQSIFMFHFLGMSRSASAILFAGRDAYIFDGIITDSDSTIAPQQEDMEQLKLTLKTKDSYGSVSLNNSDYHIFNDIFNNSFI